MNVHQQIFVPTFDPALYGGPATLVLQPDPAYTGPLCRLHATTYYLKSQSLDRTDTGKTELASDKSCTIPLPAPAHSCVIGVSVSDGLALHADYRTLYVPDGKLIDYTGSHALLEPPDLGEFWSLAKQELASVPMNTKITHIRDYKLGRLYKIRLDSIASVPIFGWYFVPKDVDLAATVPSASRYPAVQIMPGYGGEEQMHNRAADGIITLSLNPRGHGPSAEHFTLPPDHHLSNIEDLPNYYYRQAFLDCIRGIDFLASRPEIEPHRIAVEGSSQGGAFALATAALDSRICSVSAHIPTFINFPDSLYVATAGSAVKTARLIADPQKRYPVLRTISYIDLAFLCKWITCPALISSGLQDCICPPINGIVAYNRLNPNISKKLVLDPTAAHTYSPLMQHETKQWQSRCL